MKIMWTAEIQILNEDMIIAVAIAYLSNLGKCHSANAEVMSSNPVEVPTSFRVNLQLPQLPLRRSYLHLNLYFLYF